MPALRILIADDHAAVRRSVRALLESRTQWIVCAEVANGEEAVERTAEVRPDVVLLDFEMPKLNGLEAARRIRDRAPTVQIIVLTMHEVGRVNDEARRAGARVVVAKSDADRDLIDAIESLREPDMAIPLAGSVVRERRHIAAFFRSEQERYRVLTPFVADGLARGEKAVHIIDPATREAHIEQLMHAGIDAHAAEARHQLELKPWEDVYLRDGYFNQFVMTDKLRQTLNDARAEGYPITRAVADGEWALSDRPGGGDLAEYEARLNDALADHADVVICAYNLMKFPVQVMFDVLRSHPAVILGEQLHDNSFYTLPAQMIEELRQRDH